MICTLLIFYFKIDFRGTPTATGPNSFAKGKLGFSNTHKIRQRELEKGSDEPETKKKKFWSRSTEYICQNCVETGFIIINITTWWYKFFIRVYFIGCNNSYYWACTNSIATDAQRTYALCKFIIIIIIWFRVVHYGLHCVRTTICYEWLMLNTYCFY